MAYCRGGRLGLKTISMADRILVLVCYGFISVSVYLIDVGHKKWHMISLEREVRSYGGFS